MSVQAISWAMRQDVPSSGAKFVLVVLANYANHDGLAFPSIPTISSDTSQGERTVQRHLRYLETEGYVERLPSFGQNGGRSSDVYRLSAESRPDVDPSPLRERRAEWNRIRERVAPKIRARDGGRCLGCEGTKRLVTTHIVPLSAGGTNHEDNLQTLCWECSASKKSNENRRTATPGAKSTPGAGVANGTTPGADLAPARYPPMGDNLEPSVEPSRNTPLESPHRSSDDTEAFDRFWAIYPKRAGSNPRRRAFAAWTALLEDGAQVSRILDGVRAYARFCEVTDKLNTEYVMQASTFLGPDRHFEEAWSLPSEPAKKPFAPKPPRDSEARAVRNEYPGQGRGSTGRPMAIAEILNEQADREQSEEHEEIRIRSWEKEQPDQAELAWREAHEEVLAEPNFRTLPPGTLERLVRSRYRTAVLTVLGASARAGDSVAHQLSGSSRIEPAAGTVQTPRKPSLEEDPAVVNEDGTGVGKSTRRSR